MSSDAMHGRRLRGPTARGVIYHTRSLSPVLVDDKICVQSGTSFVSAIDYGDRRATYMKTHSNATIGMWPIMPMKAASHC